MTLRTFSYGGGQIAASESQKCYTVCNEIRSPGGAGNAPGMRTQEVIPVATPQYTPIPQLNQADIARFWSKVDTSAGPDGCWPWRGKPNAKGYGRFGLNRAVYIAHRVAFALVVASPPSDRAVCHTCDNPACCNPAHHFLGTTATNNRDMWTKGRGRIPHQHSRTTFSAEFFAVHGHPRAKLTWEQVRAIRALPQRYGVLSQLARQFGVSVPVIDAIREGRTWKER